MKKISSLWKSVKSASKIKIAVWSLVGIVVLVGGYVIIHKKSTTNAFITVTQGPITETVSVTGNTTPTASVSLGFGNSGIVSAVYSDVGQSVSVGQLLAQLDTGDLDAQLNQAEADVDSEKAKLAGLQAGSQPEDIAVSQAELAKSQQDLTNMYSSVTTTLTSGLNSVNDAIYNQLSNFFSNGDTSNPQLNFSSTDSQASIDTLSKRVIITSELQNWTTELSTLNETSAPSNLDTALQNGINHLAVVQSFLSNVATVANSALTVPPGVASVTVLKSDTTAAITEVDDAVTSINTAAQNIASQKLIVAQLQAELALKVAGSTAQDIAAQEAQVAEAEASVDSINAKLRDSQITAPQNGVITQFDAKVGQVASPDTPLISIISNNSFEIDANVSEVDVGKINIGDKITMTLDAFPNETFTGSVFYIDPAQTDDAGIVGYKIKASFDTPDPRIKSGLTVNMDITTKQKPSVLILPQYAILQNDSGAFVEVMQGGVASDTPVTLGIQDENGNVEILSGVTAGEQVLNIGLKK